MSRRSAIYRVIGATTAVFLLVACGSRAVSPTATSTTEPPEAESAQDPTSVPPTATSTPVPPTSTPTSTPSPPTATLAPASGDVSISGSIMNLEDVLPLLTEDSYLQLAELGEEGWVALTMDENGKIETVSDLDLPQIPISPDGTFEFEVESLEPGTYIIIAQPFKSPDGLIHSMALIQDPENVELFKVVELEYIEATDSFVFETLGNEEAYVTIEIPEDIVPPIDVDLGEIEIQLLDTDFP